MSSTTIPILRYRDADAAIAWLRRAFGFQVFLRVDGGPGVEHARLTLEKNMIMLASLGRKGHSAAERPSPFEQSFKTPERAGGVTQAILMTVGSPDRIYESARAAGAKVIDEIADFEFGGRLFSCEDLESHVWVFSSGDAWKKTW